MAALTLILDMLKGFCAVWLTTYYLPGGEILAAAGAFFGHLYPVWLGFKGGKGSATYGGILFGLFWPGGLIYASVWLVLLRFHVFHRWPVWQRDSAHLLPLQSSVIMIWLRCLPRAR
jgi:glycerol-3-phosphate acyltransferase PlsY